MSKMGVIAFLLILGSLNSAWPEPPILRISLEQIPETLDWGAARSITDRYLSRFLMRGMFQADSQGKAICDLCKSFEVLDGGKRFRFQLRRDVRWSDGKPLVAQHFIDAWRRLFILIPAVPIASDLWVIAGAPAHPALVSREPWELEVRLSQPRGDFPFLLTQVNTFPIRKEKTGGKKPDPRGEGMASGPTLGPYQLAAWEGDRRIVIEGNPSYAEARPVYRVDFLLGPHSAQIERYRKGQLDILVHPTTEDAMALGKGRISVSPYLATRMLVFNFNSEIWGNGSPLRRAVLLALAREQIPEVLKNGELAAAGLLPPGALGHRALALVSADPVQALAQRALIPGENVTLRLRLRDSSPDRALLPWLESQLRKIRISIAPIFETSPRPAPRSESWDGELTTRVLEGTSPTGLLQTFRTGNPKNAGHFSRMSFDALLAQAESEGGANAAHPSVDQATELLEVQEVAAIPLGYPTQAFFVGPRVNAFSMTRFGDPDLVGIKLKE